MAGPAAGGEEGREVAGKAVAGRAVAGWAVASRVVAAVAGRAVREGRDTLSEGVEGIGLLAGEAESVG